MALVCSKRSKQILANARLVSHECGTVKAVWSPQTSKSCYPPSPPPSWWDDIYEANDLNVKLKRQRSARRKLFISPVKSAVPAVERMSPRCDVVEAPADLHKHCDVLIGTVICDEITNNCPEPSTPPVQGIVERSLKKSQEVCSLTSTDREHRELAAIDVTNIQPMCATTWSCRREQLPGLNDNERADLSLDLANSSLKCLSKSSNEATSSIVKSGSNGKNKFTSHKCIEEAKLALNSGLEHTTSKGKVRKARSIRQSCLNSCKRCVHPRLTDTERLCLNKEFWGLKNHMDQWKFILMSVTVFSPKKKFVASGTKGEKLSSRSYFFLINGQRRKVCKTMFRSTLCICDSWIDNAISHRSDSDELQEDRRGKHMNRPKRGPKK